jgi:hypothetical protein
MRLALALIGILLLATSAQAAEKACRAEIGEQRAAELVRQCIDISPATHPPCHADNPCALIRDEIRRGCKAAIETPGGDAPNYCDEENYEGD